MSIRELLQWVRHILWDLPDVRSHQANSCNYGQQATQQGMLHQPDSHEMAAGGVPKHLLADTAYAVYAARFRCPAARAAVTEVLACKGWPAPALAVQPTLPSSGSPAASSSSFQVLCEASSRHVCIGDVALHGQPAKHQSHPDINSGLPDELLHSALEVHAAVISTVCQADFIQAHGLYMVQQSWLLHWLHHVQQQGLRHGEQVGGLGLYLYCSRLRHVAARLKIATVFINQFNLHEVQAQRLAQAAAAVAAGAADAFPYQDILPRGVKLEVPTIPAKPFVLTPRVLRAWALAGRFVVSEDPLLLVGKDGCGKSEALKALSWLLGEQLQQLNITPGEPRPWMCVG